MSPSKRLTMTVGCVIGVLCLIAPSGWSAPRTRGLLPQPWEGTWSTPGPPLASTLAMDEIGSVAAGYDGHLVALDPQGAALWTTEVAGDDLGNEIALLPHLVIVPTDDRVTALDRATGTVRWERPATKSRVTTGPLGDGTDGVLAATARGEIMLLDAATGDDRVRMTLPAPRPNGAPYVWISEGSAAVAWTGDRSCCHLGGVDLETGALRWHSKITHDSTVPVVHRGRMVVAANRPRDREGAAVAYDIVSGDVAWETPLPGTFGPGLWGDASGNNVVVTNAEGSVLSLDLDVGSSRWTSEPVEPSPEARPKIAGDRVFLTPLNVGVIEIDRTTGEVLQAGPLTPEVYVHYSAGGPGRFELLVGTGVEAAIWAFEPSDAARSAAESR